MRTASRTWSVSWAGLAFVLTCLPLAASAQARPAESAQAMMVLSLHPELSRIGAGFLPELARLELGECILGSTTLLPAEPCLRQELDDSLPALELLPGHAAGPLEPAASAVGPRLEHLDVAATLGFALGPHLTLTLAKVSKSSVLLRVQLSV